MCNTFNHTWLDATATTALVSKIGMATIQTWLPFDARKNFKALFSQSIVGPLKCGDYSRCGI